MFCIEIESNKYQGKHKQHDYRRAVQWFKYSKHLKIQNSMVRNLDVVKKYMEIVLYFTKSNNL